MCVYVCVCVCVCVSAYGMHVYMVCGICVWCVYMVCVCLPAVCMCIRCVVYMCGVCIRCVCVRGVVRTKKGELSDCSFPPSFLCAVLGFDTDRSWQSAQHTERVRWPPAHSPCFLGSLGLHSCLPGVTHHPEGSHPHTTPSNS